MKRTRYYYVRMPNLYITMMKEERTISFGHITKAYWAYHQKRQQWLPVDGEAVKKAASETFALSKDYVESWLKMVNEQ